MTELNTAKLDQATYWSRTGGEAWVGLQALVDRLYEPIERAVVERAFPGAGGRALDVGCGAGATTLAMARWVGPDGLSLGVDISGAQLALARDRAAREGLGSARFVEGDAQAIDLGAEPFDAVVSRFGVMFFANFDAAFAHLRRAARPGATLAFASWRSPADNPLAMAPAMAAAPLLPPMPTSDPEAPGRFALARAERVRGILERTGWRDVDIQPLDVVAPMTVEELVTLGTGLGTIGAVLPSQEPAVREAVTRAVRDRLEPLAENGIVHMPSACWLATAVA